MNKKKLKATYSGFITEIKQNIIKSRYQAARLANREQLLLYLYIGKRLSEKIEAEKLGAKVLQQISGDLQNELPGLRGYSYRNLMKMVQFSNEYSTIVILPLPTAELQKARALRQRNSKSEKLPLPTAEINAALTQSVTAQLKKNINSSLLTENQLRDFFSISFTHHIILLNKCKNKQERLFYIQLTSAEMLSASAMEHHIKAKTYKRLGKLPNNFNTSLPVTMRPSALNVFKDEYLFDFMQLDDDEDERVFEDKIVTNIRKFILSLGKGFAFIGNQYRLELEEKEYFTDLLFYNRLLQCLGVFELKRGKFKPEYAGKLNFYLNVLDDKVKLPNENPSIGIILCKEKNNTLVEYSFRNIHKAMGVATYRLSTEVPKRMKGILPDAGELKKLL